MSSAEGSDRLTAGLIIAAVLAVLVAVAYPLLHVPATGYAAASAPPSVTVTHTTSETAFIIYQHRAMAHNEKVVLDAYVKAEAVKAARVKAAKAKAAAQLAAQQAQAQQPGGAISTAGFSAFKACVAMRESTDGQGSTNIYGILGGLWPGVPSDPWYSLASRYSSAWTAPASVQSQVFDMIYAQQGTAPWAPYDGC